MVRNQELLDRCFLEQIALVLANERQSLLALLRLEAQIEQRCLHRYSHHRGLQFFITKGLSRKILRYQRDVVQRISIQSPFWIDRFDDLLERALLVGLRLNDRAFDFRHTLLAGFGASQLRADGQKIHEATDQVFDLLPVASGHDRSENQVILTAPFVQRDCQARHQHCKRGASFALAQLRQPFGYIL